MRQLVASFKKESFKKDKKSAKLAQEAFKRDRNGLVAAEASLALGRIQAKGAREFLENAVERESDRDVIRRYALRGMGELGDKREWESVARWLPCGRPPETRMAAIDVRRVRGELSCRHNPMA